MAIDERRVSLCIPNYNRYELLIESFINVIADERVDEIIISDDKSNEDIYEKVKSFVSAIPKIKLHRNEENQDCYKNKKTAVSYSKNAFVILFDSDNTLSSGYIDKIFNVLNWENYAACLPCWAMPHFDYREFAGRVLTKENIHHLLHSSTLTTCLNTANFFVNKDFYLQCWDGSCNPHTSDSIYMNYLLLKNGGRLYIVPDLYYQHRVDDHRGEEGGHYNSNNHKTGNFHNEVLQKLRELR